jgi:hypothetical protein
MARKKAKGSERSRACAVWSFAVGAPNALTPSVALTITQGTLTMTSKMLRNIMIAGAAISALGITACQPSQNNTDAANATAAAASDANAAASNATAAASDANAAASNAAAMTPPPTNTTTTTTNTTTTNTTN